MAKATKSTVKPKAAKKSASITVNFCVLGKDAEPRKFPEGITHEQISAKLGLKGLTTKVNGKDVQGTYVYKNGDTLVAVPQVKDGI